VKDYFRETRSTLYVVMEAIEGEELLDRIKGTNGGRGLGEEASRMYFHQMVQRVAELKGRWRLAHGDVSPENVMVTNDGEVVLIDFGMSFRLPSNDAPCLIDGIPRRGKEAYMSPETDEELPQVGQLPNENPLWVPRACASDHIRS
jgi:eukaryotic-like serine/threonine-protein kinase